MPMNQQHPNGPGRAVAVQQHRAAYAHGLWGNPGEPCCGKGRIVCVIELLLVRQHVLGKLGALTLQVQTHSLAQGTPDGWQRLDFIGADLHKILQPYFAKGQAVVNRSRANSHAVSVQVSRWCATARCAKLSTPGCLWAVNSRCWRSGLVRSTCK